MLVLFFADSVCKVNAQADPVTVIREEGARENEASPTPKPTTRKTDKPTLKPTNAPTPTPTKQPTRKPTDKPTPSPTEKATEKPTWWSQRETDKPTNTPTKQPTGTPTIRPTQNPTEKPTSSPTTVQPTLRPTTVPTGNPTTVQPTSFKPSGEPSSSPTDQPTGNPTQQVTLKPSGKPTQSPTVPVAETNAPTDAAPTNRPHSSFRDFVLANQANQTISSFQDFAPAHQGNETLSHTAPQNHSLPTRKPSEVATDKPTAHPTMAPSASPSQKPSPSPSSAPSGSSSSAPTQTVTQEPSTEVVQGVLLESPTQKPTKSPSSLQPLVSTLAPSVSPTTLKSTTNSAVTATTVLEDDKTDSEHDSTVTSDSPPSTPNDSASSELQTLATISISDIGEELDEADSLVVETSIVQFLSKEITEIEGVPVFFLKAHIESQDIRSKISLLYVTLDAITVDGTLDKSSFLDALGATLKDKRDQLDEHIHTVLDAFSSRGTSKPAGSNTNTGDSDGGFNTVVVAAVISLAFIVLLTLLVGCVAMARKNDIDEYEKNIAKVTNNSLGKSSQSFTGSKSKTYSITGSRSKSVSQSRSIGQSKSHGGSKSIEAFEPVQHHYDIEMCMSGPSDLSVCSDKSPKLLAPPSYDQSTMKEEVELVAIKEEGPTKAHIAAISGGGHQVQTVSNSSTRKAGLGLPRGAHSFISLHEG